MRGHGGYNTGAKHWALNTNLIVILTVVVTVIPPLAPAGFSDHQLPSASLVAAVLHAAVVPRAAVAVLFAAAAGLVAAAHIATAVVPAAAGLADAARLAPDAPAEQLAVWAAGRHARTALLACSVAADGWHHYKHQQYFWYSAAAEDFHLSVVTCQGSNRTPACPGDQMLQGW